MLNNEINKILIAEDDDLNYIIVSRIVSNYPKLNLKPERAENGFEVLEKMESESYRLVIMDIQMPEMDGFEATKIIRTKNNSIPIIGFTAFTQNSELESILQSGCNDYLTKPLNVDNLYKIFDKYLIR